MVTVLGVVGVLVVLFAAAVVATRQDQVLAPAPPDRRDLDLPAGPLSAVDLQRVRFGMALRGYRMSEVDEVLDRLGQQLHGRDAEIARLRALTGDEPAREDAAAGDDAAADGR